MDETIRLILLMFAAWRVTHLIAEEDGPFDILARFRHMIGVRYDENSVRYGKNVIAKAVNCVWCLSVWVGFGTAWLSGYAVNISGYIITALAISAAVVLFEEKVR